MSKDKKGPVSVGIGLRKPYYRSLLETKPELSFLEVHSENYFGFGPELELLNEISNVYPISLHGVGLSLGSAEGVRVEHLTHLKRLVEHINPFVVSDHVSWSLTGNAHLNDLLPLPYNLESLEKVSDNVKFTQDFLGRQILIENPSTYLTFKDDMPEHEFIFKIVEKTGCKVLLDVNNIYVNSKNHGIDPYKYITHFDQNKVGEIHLAGHSINVINGKEIRIDTHDNLVLDEVWKLYEFTIAHMGSVPTLIEWDQNIPELSVLLSEASKAIEIQRRNELKHAA